MSKALNKIQFMIIMVIFGTIGLLSRIIPVSSAVLVFYRSFIASLFLIIFSIITKRKFDFFSIKKHFILLFISGIFLALNWLLQFEACKITKLSIATICYNTMPIIFLIISPMIFKEKIWHIDIICIIVAMIGIIFVSNFTDTSLNFKESLGYIYGLLAAFFYALVVIINKKLNNINNYDKLIIEFTTTCIVFFVYILFQKQSFFFQKDMSYENVVLSIFLILVVGILHTGICYIFYYDLIYKLSTIEVALYTYFDPATSIFLSFLVLNEKMTFLQIIGGALVFASTFVNELFHLNINFRKKT